jgi:peptidoglycan-associated lipoprotein
MPLNEKFFKRGIKRMKKNLIVLLLLFAVGCTEKYSKPSNEVEAWKPVETKVVEEMVIAKEEDGVEETALSPDEEAKSVFKDVLFDFDKYIIREDARPVLDTVASFLNQNRKLHIIIEGYCDERGTNEYNLALGEKRAKGTWNYLISLGVSPARMIITTYGEEKPICSQKNETCWQRNRRAHFAVVKEEVLSELILRDTLQWDDSN